MSLQTANQTSRRLRTFLLGGTALCGAVVVGFAGTADAVPVPAMPVQGGVDLSSVNSGTVNVTTLGNVAGTVAYATTNPSGNTRTADVTLTSARTLIDWTSFTVGKTGTLNFHFNGMNDLVINRVSAGNAINVDAGGAVNGVFRTTNTTAGNIWFLADGGVFINGTVTANGILGANNSTVTAAVLTNGANSPGALKADLLAASSALIDVSGAAAATGARLDGSGNIVLVANGALSDGGSGAVNLVATGTITQSASNVLTAGTLTGASVGGSTFGGTGNLITGLGAFANTGGGGFALTNSQALNVTGAVSATGGGGLTLTTNSGGISLGGGLTTDASDTVTLTSAGAISQTSGVITAGTVTGGANGAVSLNGANLITTLGAFTNAGSGGVALTNAQALNVTGPVDSGSGRLTLTTTTGDLNFSASLTSGTAMALTAAGALTESGGGTNLNPGTDLTLSAGAAITLTNAPNLGGSANYSITFVDGMLTVTPVAGTGTGSGTGTNTSVDSSGGGGCGLGSGMGLFVAMTVMLGRLIFRRLLPS